MQEAYLDLASYYAEKAYQEKNRNEEEYFRGMALEMIMQAAAEPASEDVTHSHGKAGTNMKQAIEVPKAIVIQVATWYPAGIDPEGGAHGHELILETACRDYDHYTSLPEVVVYEGTECGKTGWSSDRNYACYKSGACIAKGRD